MLNGSLHGPIFTNSANAKFVLITPCLALILRCLRLKFLLATRNYLQYPENFLLVWNCTITHPWHLLCFWLSALTSLLTYLNLCVSLNGQREDQVGLKGMIFNIWTWAVSMGLDRSGTGLGLARLAARLDLVFWAWYYQPHRCSGEATGVVRGCTFCELTKIQKNKTWHTNRDLYQELLFVKWVSHSLDHGVCIVSI